MTETHQTSVSGPEKSKWRYTLLGVFLTIFLDLVGFGMSIPILPTVARTLHATARALCVGRALAHSDCRGYGRSVWPFKFTL